MAETKWDMQEVKRSKKIQLMQYNVLMLLLLTCALYGIKVGWSQSLFSGVFCLALWLLAVQAFYSFLTGKKIGTKANRFIERYEKAQSGQRRWKRSKLTEGFIFIIFSIGFTVIWIKMDGTAQGVEFINILPFIAGWLGFNVAEAIRIKNLRGLENVQA